jgi:colicin import membrane protein
METADRHLFAASDASTRTWATMMVVSFFCHLIFFAMVHYLPALRPEKKRTFRPVVNVTMVRLPEAASPDAAPAKKVEPASAVVKPAADKKTAVAPKPKTPARPAEPVVKHSMKKKTYQASKVVDSALSRLEEKVEVEEPPPDPLQQALDRLRRQVDETETAGGPKEAPAASSGKTDAGLVGGDSEGIRKELELIDIYRMEIAWRVQKNWAFPESLAGGEKDLVVELAFTVLPNGEIRDVWFDKRSGNRYLDESAKRAVLKANPVGPHPEGISKPTITVGLRFTPEGVQ